MRINPMHSSQRKKFRDTDQTKRQRTLDGFFLSLRAEPSDHSVPNSLGLSFNAVASSSRTTPPSAYISLTLDNEVAGKRTTPPNANLIQAENALLDADKYLFISDDGDEKEEFEVEDLDTPAEPDTEDDVATKRKERLRNRGELRDACIKFLLEANQIADQLEERVLDHLRQRGANRSAGAESSACPALPEASHPVDDLEKRMEQERGYQTMYREEPTARGHDLNQGCAAIPQRVAIQPCSDETTGYRTFRSPVFLSIKVHRAYFTRHSTNTVNLSKSPGEANSFARIWAFTSEAFYRLGREAAFFRYQHVHTERLERVEIMYVLSMRL